MAWFPNEFQVGLIHHRTVGRFAQGERPKPCSQIWLPGYICVCVFASLYLQSSDYLLRFNFADGYDLDTAILQGLKPQTQRIWLQTDATSNV